MRVRTATLDHAQFEKMAAKNTQQLSLAEGVDKELTCAICLCRYDHPKILPCLHSYCKGCLEKLAKKTQTRPKQQLTCPQCKEVHQIPPQGIDAFKTYFTINNLIELLRVHEATTPKENAQHATILCESGVDESPAVAHCLTCSDHLCESCFELHKKQKVTRDHNVVMLKDLQQLDRKTGVKSVRRKLLCDEHKDELLKLFCKTCEKVICRDCALVKHRQHEYVFVHEFRHEAQKQLELLVKKVEEKQAEFKVHSEHLAEVCKSCSAAFDASKQEASAFFDKMVQSIEARRKKVFTDLDTLNQTEEKKLNAETDYLELALARLSNSIQFTKKMFDNEDDVEMMLMSTQAKPALETLQQLAWDKKKAQVKPLRIIFDKNDLQKCESMGVIFNRSLKDNDFVISQLPAYIRGSLSFDIALSQEVSKLGIDFTPLVSVQVIHRDGSEELVGIHRRDLNKWQVLCEPNRYGQLKVTVKVDNAVKVHQVDIQPKSLSVGMKVVRGPDWDPSYGDQDGGAGAIGEVAAVENSGDYRIAVKWPNNGHFIFYRWGNVYYDLKVV